MGLLNSIKSFFGNGNKERIPATLDEAVDFLETFISPLEQSEIEQGVKNATDGHHGIGRWMRNNWGLWSMDSELAQFFINKGIRHADDMSGIILEAFQARLRGETFDLDKRVKYYRDYWRQKGVNPDEIAKGS